MSSNQLPPGAHDFRVVRSELLVEAPIIAVRRDTVIMPGGHPARREIVEHFGAVAVVAIDEAGRVPLVYQYRQCVHQRLWELPAGILDVLAEDPLTAARRELREEAGVGASEWALLLDLVTSPGFCEEACRVFLARGLCKEDRPCSEGDEEADMVIHWIPLAEAITMIQRGEIHNSIAVAGLFAAASAIAESGLSRRADEPFILRPNSLVRRRMAAGAQPGTDLKRVVQDG